VYYLYCLKYRMSAIKGRAGSSTPGSLSHEIDHTDKAILRTLQRNASLSNVALAAKVTSVPRHACDASSDSNNWA